ncbi:MAG: universal stress protein [Chlorobi bacterium CHB2]|nr:universal stress protein [Chlorobi bacterium CHB2]
MKIIIAYDGSQCSRDTLAELDRAGLPSEGVEAMVVTVAEMGFSAGKLGAGVSAGRMQQAMELAHSTAKEAAEYLRQRFPAWIVETEESGGSPTGAIIHCSRRWNADLIIIGSHGRSLLGRMFMGSVSQSVMSEADCSVRVARGRASLSKETRLLLAVDGSSHSLDVAAAVTSRKWRVGTEARVIAAVEPIFEAMAPPVVPEISVWDATEGLSTEAHLQRTVEVLQQRLQQAGLAASAVVGYEDPKQMILQEAEGWGADCIFMGARGLNPIDRLLLGSVSRAVVPRAHCSVEVVRKRATAALLV